MGQNLNQKYSRNPFKSFDMILIIILILLSFLGGYVVANNSANAQTHIQQKSFSLGAIYPPNFSDYYFGQNNKQNFIQFNLQSNQTNQDYIYIPGYFTFSDSVGIISSNTSLTVYGFQRIKNALSSYTNYTLSIPYKLYSIVPNNPYNQVRYDYEIQNAYSFVLNKTNQGLLLVGHSYAYSNVNFFLLYSFSETFGFTLVNYLIIPEILTNTLIKFDPSLNHDVLFYSTFNGNYSNLNLTTNFGFPQQMESHSIEFANNTYITTFNLLSYNGVNNFTFVQSDLDFISIVNYENNKTTILNNILNPAIYSNGLSNIIIPDPLFHVNEFIGISNNYKLYFFDYTKPNYYLNVNISISIPDLRSNNLNAATSNIISIQFSKSIHNNNNLDFSVVGYNQFNDIFITYFDYNPHTNNYDIDISNSHIYKYSFSNTGVESVSFFNGTIYIINDNIYYNSSIIILNIIPLNTDLLSFNNNFELILSVVIALVSFFFFLIYFKFKNVFKSSNDLMSFIYSRYSTFILYLATILCLLYFWASKFFSTTFSYDYLINNLLLILNSIVLVVFILEIKAKKSFLYYLLFIVNVIFLIFYVSPFLDNFSISLHIHYTLGAINTTTAQFLVSGNIIFGLIYGLILIVFGFSILIIFQLLKKKIETVDQIKNNFDMLLISEVILTIFTGFYTILLVSSYIFINLNDTGFLINIYIITVILIIIMLGSVIVIISKMVHTLFKNLLDSKIGLNNPSKIESPSLSKTELNNIFIGITSIIAVFLFLYNYFILKTQNQLNFILSHLVALLTIIFLNLQLIYVLLVILGFMLLYNFKIKLYQESLVSKKTNLELLSFLLLLFLSLPNFLVGFFIVTNLLIIFKFNTEDLIKAPV